MKNTNKILNILNELYPNPQPFLYHHDPYTLLISVLLSAQCKDDKVNEVVPILFSKASTPEEMIRLSVEKIEDIIRPIGLSTKKSQAIWTLSHQIIDNYNGKVPNTFAELESLSGIGHKSASVVMSQAFNIPAFPVDTHIHRCAKRWHLSDGSSVQKTEEDLKKKFPKKYWNRLHLQIICFARKYCQARNHKIAQCPICSWISVKN